MVKRMSKGEHKKKSNPSGIWMKRDDCNELEEQLRRIQTSLGDLIYWFSSTVVKVNE